MYDERWMFHEPAYQAVAEITASGTNGIRGRLRDLPAPGALLDAAGQLYGYWVMRAADRDYVAFPMRIDAIRYFGPGPDAGDLRFSDDLVIGFTTEALVGPVEAFPPQFVLVGPSMEGRPEPVDFPWDWLDPDRPGVLVSLGTVNADAGARFYATVVEALGDRGKWCSPRLSIRSAPSPTTCWCATTCPRWPSATASTPSSRTAATTRGASRWHAAVRSCWRPSATTSRSSPSRSWMPGRAFA
jgi:hypothetical protein